MSDRKLSPTDLGRWVNEATRGEQIGYTHSTEDELPAPTMLQAARRLYDLGLVTLTTKLLPDGRRAYLAQRTRLKRDEPRPVSKPRPKINATVMAVKRAKAPAAQDQAAPLRFCAVQGCHRPLHRTNTSGVCPPHLHRIGVCGCRDCREARP